MASNAKWNTKETITYRQWVRRARVVRLCGFCFKDHTVGDRETCASRELEGTGGVYYRCGNPHCKLFGDHVGLNEMLLARGTTSCRQCGVIARNGFKPNPKVILKTCEQQQSSIVRAVEGAGALRELYKEFMTDQTKSKHWTQHSKSTGIHFIKSVKPAFLYTDAPFPRGEDLLRNTGICLLHTIELGLLRYVKDFINIFAGFAKEEKKGAILEKAVDMGFSMHGFKASMLRKIKQGKEFPDFCRCLCALTIRELIVLDINARAKSIREVADASKLENFFPVSKLLASRMGIDETVTLFQQYLFRVTRVAFLLDRRVQTEQGLSAIQTELDALDVSLRALRRDLGLQDSTLKAHMVQSHLIDSIRVFGSLEVMDMAYRESAHRTFSKGVYKATNGKISRDGEVQMLNRNIELDTVLAVSDRLTLKPVPLGPSPGGKSFGDLAMNWTAEIKTSRLVFFSSISQILSSLPQHTVAEGEGLIEEALLARENASELRHKSLLAGVREQLVLQVQALGLHELSANGLAEWVVSSKLRFRKPDYNRQRCHELSTCLSTETEGTKRPNFIAYDKSKSVFIAMLAGISRKCFVGGGSRYKSFMLSLPLQRKTFPETADKDLFALASTVCVYLNLHEISSFELAYLVDAEDILEVSSFFALPDKGTRNDVLSFPIDRDFPFHPVSESVPALPRLVSERLNAPPGVSIAALRKKKEMKKKSKGRNESNGKKKACKTKEKDFDDDDIDENYDSELEGMSWKERRLKAKLAEKTAALAKLQADLDNLKEDIEDDSNSDSE